MTIKVFKGWRSLLWVCLAVAGCTSNAPAAGDNHLVETEDAGSVVDASGSETDAGFPEAKVDAGVVVDMSIPVDVGVEPDASVARPPNGVCGDGIWNESEECDDGNVDSYDGCDADCTIGHCGNGFISPGEDCDDGNAVDGDGCSSSCHFE